MLRLGVLQVSFPDVGLYALKEDDHGEGYLCVLREWLLRIGM